MSNDGRPTQAGPRARFDKFGWLKALRVDPVITGTSAFHVGVDLCTTFTWSDGVGWVFELASLPAVGGKPLTRNTVNAAIRLLEDRGFIAVTYRSRGGRGVVAAMSVDLKPVRSNVPVSPETSATGDAGLPETGPIEAQGFGENQHNPTAKPAQLNVETSPIQRSKKRSEQREAPLQGISSGITSGDACAREDEPAAPAPGPPRNDPPANQTDENSATCVAADLRSGNTRNTISLPSPDELAAADGLPRPPNHWPKSFPEPEPSRYCPDHPDDTTDRCRACEHARKAYPDALAAWEQRRQHFDTHRRQAKDDWDHACTECDEGWLLSADGSPVEPAIRCLHARLWQAYWTARGVLPLRVAA